ncbi:hypothetical protein GUITHDRAFT_110111 [Guillardia theta CCMP2712]|uniref:Uncharacterized protein n=1 Tax=Guillardia theta (strain CCMP2712) TaxID=905079 RepID=L1J7E7_GUITC|nr:hypothetical protein GUITHDRAFT_110111 [Guillardia theta CCMP2712]EKX44005.1 hypothetical protein GUITHDRAFT_110111 [Guillardia theta CCMP2712]|eukprot:XP_005830985.1 hypothetical protein GUITHDRAFT_110111 [Guillardia theta CCMP2712]
MILNAKKALDNKADSEIRLLQGEKFAAPRTPKTTARHEHEAQRSNEASRNVVRPSYQKEEISKQDLAKFVSETIAEEKKIMKHASKHHHHHHITKGTQQLSPQSQHPTQGDKPKLSYWCEDNPNWRGPFGDACVSYAVGGDRQFWCDWDGAGDMGACPVACGTCNPGYYYRAEQDERREHHLLHEHFDPQVAPPSKEVKINITVNQGPQVPISIARQRDMQANLFHDIEEMKEDLKKVVEITQEDARERKKKEKDSIQPAFISSEEANRDMARFYSQESAKKDKIVSMKNASWALTDLMSWFNKQEKQIQIRDLRERKRHRLNGHATPAKEGDYDFLKFPQMQVDKTIKTRRLSERAADDDMQHYWKLALSNTSRSSMASFSSARARRELGRYLESKLQSAKALHREARDSAERRRKANGLGWEAVKADSKMSTEQSEADIEKFWNSMPTEAVRIHPTGKKQEAPEKTKKPLARKPVASNKHDPGRSLSRRRSADLARAGRMMNDEESKSDMQTYWNTLTASTDLHTKARGGHTRSHTVKQPSIEEEVNSLGLPTGGAEAVALPHRPLTSEAAHASLEDYFSKMVKRAKQLDGYDRKTREKLIAEAKLRAKKRAMLAAAKGNSQLFALARRQEVMLWLYQAPAPRPMAPGASGWAPVAAWRQGGAEPSRAAPAWSQAQERRLEYQQAYSNFLNNVNAQVPV